jgi:hypothetical protein
MPLTLRKPDRVRLTLLALMLVVAYGGHTQSWAFSGKNMGLPSPPLANVFVSIPYLWQAWVILLAPLVLALRLVRLDGLFNTGLVWFFWAVQALWFYLLACLICLAWQHLIRRIRQKN